MTELEFAEDSQNIFFRCVEDCSESIMITDTRGRLQYVNPAWQKTYGYERGEALGKTPGLLHSGLQDADFYREMWRRIEDPAIGTWSGELVNRSKEGRLVPVLLTVTPFKIGGETVGYMGIALDVSERKKLEAQVMRQDRLASVGILASGLAHEIGTPLGVIRGRAEFLQIQAGQQIALKSGLQVIIDQIDRISKLISSLLRFSRSKVGVEVKPSEIKPVVAEVINLLEEKFRRLHIGLEVDIPDHTQLFADPGRTQQILINLVVNALHAIQSEMKPERSDGRPPRIEGHKVSIRLVPGLDAQTLGIEVRDTGCGIDPKDLKMIFQPFFTTKEVGEGTGLGLPIVEKLVHEMDGDLAVSSAVGEGTAFTIYLRRAPQE